ncbi:hypothetical protein Q8G35_13450 [Peribacillus simplex]|uniref:Uncharacterized protein n=2 Tax=Peribacillus TaxID=2675229 RepID=A0AA90P269_9BACI|nr:MULTISPECIES: hypothetical protein [Peribacillus]MDP1419411.1 hypothetical protein [Peribacillus simplex]MDP1452244.1 hypothetical protein [Peribacillus frigoritolerans]
MQSCKHQMTKEVVDYVLRVKEVVQAGEKEMELTENSFNGIIGVIKGNITGFCRNGNDNSGISLNHPGNRKRY